MQPYSMLLLAAAAAVVVVVARGAVLRLTVHDEESHGYRDWEPAGPGTYAFGYDIDEPSSSNVQFRNEQRLPNGTVTGSYGYVAPDGSVHVVHYVADQHGYRASLQQPSILYYV